jgi:L-ascorbate metabolism protein UlaG (beta-lactamase superfamily)
LKQPGDEAWRTTRRRFVVAAGAALLALPARAATEPASLRLCKLRHSSFLVELGGVRALFDPSFARGLGFGPLLEAPEPGLTASRVGAHQLLLVTSGRADHFHARGARELKGRDTWCLAPSDAVAKKLRGLGYARVRVVGSGDVVMAAGVEVRVSPAAEDVFGGAAVGYRLTRGGRSLWHTGAPRPLDMDGGPVRFAREHESEAVLACWDALSVPHGRRVTMGALDAQLLAALARARVVIPQHDDARPSWLGGLVLGSERGPERRSLPGGPPMVVVERGVWYRLRQATRRPLAPSRSRN